MDNQELFDRYISNELSASERQEFETLLKTDKELADEFKLFLLIVKGIRAEEEQDCADFGNAMRRLTKEQLREIVGAKPKQKKKSNKLIKPWLWSSISAAAVVIIVVAVSFHQIRQSQTNLANTQNAAYDIIAENNFIGGVSRGGDECIDINIDEASEAELEVVLPKYELLYKDAETIQEIQDNGLNLAMVYLKLHNKDKAIEILSELKQRYAEEDADFAEECTKIISQIEKL